jgi:hypothetical protein
MCFIQSGAAIPEHECRNPPLSRAVLAQEISKWLNVCT